MLHYVRCSIFLWRRSDTLCISGFMDDAMFAHKPRLLDVATQLKYSAHAVAGQRTHGTTFRVLEVISRAATPGAESAVYDKSNMTLIIFDQLQARDNLLNVIKVTVNKRRYMQKGV